MPFPVPYWASGTEPSSKLFNLALYADDGSATGTPGVFTGILFHANRCMLLECIVLWPGTIPGTGESRLDRAGNGGAVYWNVLDTSALLGPGSDVAGQRGFYDFNAALPGSAGDGTGAAGGYYVVSHVIPVQSTVTQQLVGANLQTSGDPTSAGSRQAINPNRDNSPFYLDLRLAPSGSTTLNPSVVNWDPGGATHINVLGSVAQDGYSGETPRFFAFWAGVNPATWHAPSNTPPLPVPWPSWGPSTTIGTGGFTDVNINASSGIADVANFLSNPPLFRGADNSGATISTAENSVVPLSATVDNFSGWAANRRLYTIQRDGLYLCHAAAAWDTLTGTDTAQRMAGIAVNGTIYWGPGYVNPGSLTAIAGTLPLTNCISTKTQVFSLRAGDTVQMFVRQNSGGDVSLSSGDESRMFCVWLCAPGSPAGSWVPPDTSYRWQAGTKDGDLVAALNAHLANDLGFLVNRPWFTGWQSTSQSFGTFGDWNTVRMNQVTGIVHGDAGDPWNGWSAGSGNAYAAPVDGWYLVCAEYFTAWPPTTAQISAGLNTPTQGAWAPQRTPDVYQKIVAPPANFVPGATAFGTVYLLAGETVQPQVLIQDAGPGATFAGVNDGGQNNCHIECVWLGE